MASVFNQVLGLAIDQNSNLHKKIPRYFVNSRDGIIAIPVTRDAENNLVSKNNHAPKNKESVVIPTSLLLRAVESLRRQIKEYIDSVYLGLPTEQEERVRRDEMYREATQSLSFPSSFRIYSEPLELKTIRIPQQVRSPEFLEFSKLFTTLKEFNYIKN